MAVFLSPQICPDASAVEIDAIAETFEADTTLRVFLSGLAPAGEGGTQKIPPPPSSHPPSRSRRMNF